MPTPNKLFFVRADNDDGENLDLLVVAESKAQAETFWRENYDLEASDTPQWVGDVPGVTAQCEQGPIDWDAIMMD